MRVGPKSRTGVLYKRENRDTETQTPREEAAQGQRQSLEGWDGEEAGTAAARTGKEGPPWSRRRAQASAT